MEQSSPSAKLARLLGQPTTWCGALLGAFAVHPTLTKLVEGAGLMDAAYSNWRFLYGLPDKNWFALLLLGFASWFLWRSAKILAAQDAEARARDMSAAENATVMVAAKMQQDLRELAGRIDEALGTSLQIALHHEKSKHVRHLEELSSSVRRRLNERREKLGDIHARQQISLDSLRRLPTIPEQALREMSDVRGPAGRWAPFQHVQKLHMRSLETIVVSENSEYFRELEMELDYYEKTVTDFETFVDGKRKELRSIQL